MRSIASAVEGLRRWLPTNAGAGADPFPFAVGCEWCPAGPSGFATPSSPVRRRIGGGFRNSI
jgi:hypothetical protein